MCSLLPGEMIQFDLRIFFKLGGEKPPTSCVFLRTIAFWLMDAEMYTGMGDDGTQGTVAIERGMLGDSDGFPKSEVAPSLNRVSGIQFPPWN